MNPLVTLAGETGSGAIAGATDIMGTDIGFIVYFGLGLTVIGVVLYAIKRFL